MSAGHGRMSGSEAAAEKPTTPEVKHGKSKSRRHSKHHSDSSDSGSSRSPSPRRRRKRAPAKRDTLDVCARLADMCCASACAVFAAVMAMIPLMGFTAPIVRLLTGSKSSALLMAYVITGIAVFLLLSRFMLRSCMHWRMARHKRREGR